MYKYETHLHTYPVSGCAKKGVLETVMFYKEKGYDGIFLTNHFLDGNIGIDKSLPYKEKMKFYVSDYEKAKEIGKKAGIKVFFGIESSYHGTDFLIYGLSPEWYFSHSEIMQKKRSDMLSYIRDNGGFVVSAHPFREVFYIDHIRLFPRQVDAVEVINATGTDFENKMADIYADNYGLFKIAGSDNHLGCDAKRLAGVMCEEPIMSELDFVEKVRNKKTEIFVD